MRAMHLPIPLTTLITLGALASAPVVAEPLEELRDQAHQITQQYAKALKSTLKPVMQSEGALEAIEVCNLQSPEIAASISVESGWQVGRTSLKTRNSDNQPDRWEIDKLNEFENRLKSGETPQQLEHYEMTEVNGQKTFRYLKAIPTGELCLACHGEGLEPAVIQQLDKLYPFDQARGFKKGDLRGAFTLSKSIP